MAEVIRMPRLSDTMEEGNIVSWLKNEGETVSPGDILAEVETDKATMELESFHSGTLLYIGVKEGPVPVDGLIAIIGSKDEDVQAILKEAEAGTPIAEAPASSVESASPAPATRTSPVATAPVVAPTSNGDMRIKASPLAKKIAEEKGLNLANIQGSGEGGRIVKKDVESAPVGTESGPSLQAPVSDFNYGSHPISQMRKTIAKRLSQSKFTIPHFYLTVDIDMENAMQAREEMNEYSPVRISYNDLIIKASAIALQKHPSVNSSWMENSIEFHRHINIGVAVAVDEGLMVPVINNANLKSLSQIKTEIKELAGKAKDKKLELHEMQGNTFTISNLGMFDIEEFTAIINPPDACILAVGSIMEKPVVKNGAIVVGHRMKVTLSCDHRIVDGATGAQFLQTLKGLLESPYRLLV